MHACTDYNMVCQCCAVCMYAYIATNASIHIHACMHGVLIFLTGLG